MPLDPQIRDFLDAMKRDPPAPPFTEVSPDEGRRNFDRMRRATAGLPVEVGAVEDLVLPGPAGDLRARLYVPAGDGTRLTAGLVFFHGGGWVFGDLESHDALCRTICREADLRVVAVDYRLAPEHRFPAAVDDAVAATEWVASQAGRLGINPGRLAVGGDSAGGNLAAVVALHAREHGPALRFQALIYPVTDSRTDTASYEENRSGYMLERDGMRWFFDRYAPDAQARSDPRLAPLRAHTHAGLPPALVVTAGFDPLRDDGTAYAAALRAAGTPVTLVENSSLIHGFLGLVSISDAAAAAASATAAAIGEALR